MDETHLRWEIVRIGRLLYEKGFIVSTDGNISARLGTNRVLVTPSGLHKGFLQPDELIVTDLDRHPLIAPPGLEPTSEMPMHLEVYRQRPDVKAVVHAHLPFTIALSIAGVPLDPPMLPEVVLTVGAIPTTEYALPSSQENADAIHTLIQNHDAIVLRRHGVITVGSGPFEAFMKMETVEHTAKIVHSLELLGRGKALTQQQIDDLLELRRKLSPNTKY
jgi:L-fuculose-phosphate aldolase